MNLQEETRNGYTISAEMKAVWAIQLEMVKYLLNICEKYGLKIWAEGGTLLGAVREKGYIPWDDDIDLSMLREDYDKLIDVANKEISPPYHLQSFGRERNYYRGHAQMRCDGTAAILPADIWQPFHQGIFIDIFVYDTIPDVVTSEWQSTLERADKIQNVLNSLSFRGRLTSPKLCLETIRSNLYVLKHGKKNLINEYEDIFRIVGRKYDKWVSLPCFLRSALKYYTKKKEWFRDSLFLQFEDIELPVPIDYDKVLKAQYGDDYMIPQKAPTMHGSVIFKVGEDYHSILRALRKQRLFEKVRSIRIHF